MIFPELHSTNQKIDFPDFEGREVFLKREDLLHPDIPGNKYRKLKYNILEAANLGYDTLLTFGGAYSNHIAATAAAGKLFGMKTIGVIRGEELESGISENSTLSQARECGMRFHFVSREAYRKKAESGFIASLQEKFGRFFLIPEGGTNTNAVKGCEEILTGEDTFFDYICVSVGTGGTISGIINASGENQKVIGFSALKGDFLQQEIAVYTVKNNWEITDAFCFGGYAKADEELIRFINEFRQQCGIPLDSVYTGKMMYGIRTMLREGVFPKKSRILAVHTGGLQGISGMNKILSQKNLPLIEI